MRIGQNPAKAGIKVRKPRPLGIAVITFIPDQTGYFEESLNILKIELASLRKNTSEEFDLYLFDNGSCAEAQAALLDLNQKALIDFLFLSYHNIGKFGAMNWLMAMMPNEWIVYTDSDFYFREQWLEESIRLFKVFPEAGMITAQPNIFDQLEGKSYALDHIDPNEFQVVKQKLERSVIEDYCKGIGATEEIREKFLNMDSLVVNRKTSTIQAVFGACTAQFMGKREFLQQVFPIPTEFVIAREEDNELCRKVDRMGRLQLSTMKPFVVHMGNHLDESILQEAGSSNLLEGHHVVRISTSVHKTSVTWKIFVALNRISILRKIFKRLYVNLFELYSIEKK